MINEFAILVALLTAGYFIGLEFGLVAVGICLALFLFGLLQVVQAHKLLVYLSGKATENPISFSYLWKNIYRWIKRLEQKDQHQAREFQTLLRFQESVSALPIGIVFLNERNRIEWFNKAAGRFLSLRNPDDFGRDITYFLRQPELAAGLKNKEATVRLTLNLGGFNLDMFITDFENRHFILVQDMTHLQNLQEARRELLSDVSHELRSPLTVIQAYAEMLNTDKEADVQEMSREILNYTKEMNVIIDNLLASELLDTRPLTAEKCEVIDVSVVAKELVEEGAKLFPEKKCSIDVDIESTDKIYGNRYEIICALNNLLHNALRYSHTGGTVRLLWQTDTNGGHFSVIDHGKGIPAEHIPRLTERFYRVDKDRARESGGIGLGLAIVKRILQRHHAHLHIESEVGKGSIFRCDFGTEMLRP